MPTTENRPAPRTAWEAAELLAAEGKHVHHVAEGDSVCVSKHCLTSE